MPDAATIAARATARHGELFADPAPFEGATKPGFLRVSRKYIGHPKAGESREAGVIPQESFTLSLSEVQPGQAGVVHADTVEEVYFVISGALTAIIEDETGGRAEVELGPLDCLSCPPNVLHGYENRSDRPVLFQVMHGKR
jgi:mannose-6-phosphate isomerase-like protein (cupin superfamily)